nr:hypothetical protein 3 [Moraxellaceae bacterium]
MTTKKTVPTTTGKASVTHVKSDPINTAAEAAREADAVANPAPASELDDASGALVEPEVAQAVDVTHASVDANPRAGTTGEQNAVDWNDPKRLRPSDESFAGQGIDRSVYGTDPD